MRSSPYRRVPLVDREEKLVGLVSLDDILSFLTEEFHQIGRLLENETPGSLVTNDPGRREESFGNSVDKR